MAYPGIRFSTIKIVVGHWLFSLNPLEGTGWHFDKANVKTVCEKGENYIEMSEHNQQMPPLYLHDKVHGMVYNEHDFSSLSNLKCSIYKHLNN